jgi:formate dehydrogenase maturation protein FdhE
LIVQNSRKIHANSLKQLFNIDIETCSECGGEVKIIASIEDPVVIRKILAHLDDKAASVATGLMPQCRAPPPTGLFV